MPVGAFLTRCRWPKANMPTLYRQLKKLPWAEVPTVSSVTTDHGRRTRRTIKAAIAPAWVGFTGAAQVAQLHRTVTNKGKKTAEVVYLITSDHDVDPATLATWVRGHWHIENNSTGSATSPTKKTGPWSGHKTLSGRRCWAARRLRLSLRFR